MDDLVQWLRAQLDGDAARAVQWHDLECEIHAHLDGGLLANVAASRMLAEAPGAVCDCGGPARVLREIDANRQQLDLHRPEPGQHPDFCGYDKHELPCLPLRLLALPYAGRDGFQESWRP
jgi:uncharacterized protein DUF6221